MNGVAHIFNNLSGGVKLKPLAGGQNAIVSFNIPAANYFGKNEFSLDINPDNDQPEQYHFNNLVYKNLFVTFTPGCAGDAVSLIAGKYSAANTYQWQVNTGSGYTNIADDDIYTGTNRDTLIIDNAPSAMYGYKYRAIVTNNSVVSNGFEFTLKFANRWTGALDNAWEKKENWSCNKVPDANTDVIINSGLPNYPVINSNAICRRIYDKPNTSVQVNTTFSLTLTGPPAQ
jgi:hypothetical protein